MRTSSTCTLLGLVFGLALPAAAEDLGAVVNETGIQLKVEVVAEGCQGDSLTVTTGDFSRDLAPDLEVQRCICMTRTVAANPDWRLMPRDRMAVKGEDDTGNGMAAVFRISVPGYAFRVRFEAALEDGDYRRSITPEGEKPASLEALPFELVPAGSSLAIRLKDGVDPARLDLDQPQGGCACVIL